MEGFLEGFTTYNSKMLIIKHAPNLSSRTTGAAIPVSRTYYDIKVNELLIAGGRLPVADLFVLRGVGKDWDRE